MKIFSKVCSIKDLGLSPCYSFFHFLSLLPFHLNAHNKEYMSIYHWLYLLNRIFFLGLILKHWYQFSLVAQSCPILCDPMNHSTPGLPVHHQLPESTQTHAHCVGDAIQSPHPPLSPSPPAFNLSQLHGLFKWVSSPHQGAKVLEFQLQHQSFQWTHIYQK